MKPFKAVVTAVMLRRCQWRDFTCIITPPDGSVGVKYGRKMFYNIDDRVYGRKLRFTAVTYGR